MSKFFEKKIKNKGSLRIKEKNAKFIRRKRKIKG